MRRVEVSTKFEKDLKRVRKQPRFDEPLLKKLLDSLFFGETLEQKYKDHKLAKHSRPEFQGCRDFHLTPNICVVYYIDKDVLRLVRIGSHQDLGLTEELHRKNAR